MIVVLSVPTNSSLLQAITYQHYLIHTTRQTFFVTLVFLILMCDATTRITELSICVHSRLRPSVPAISLDTSAFQGSSMSHVDIELKIDIGRNSDTQNECFTVQTALQYVLIVPTKYIILCSYCIHFVYEFMFSIHK